MIRGLYIYGFLGILLFSIGSCTGTRHLQEGEYLARDGKVVVIDKTPVRKLSDTRLELVRMAEVNENSKVLWMRLRLSIHNSIKEPKKDKGFKYWLKYKFGKPPVFYNTKKAVRVKKAMEEYLFNNSFFQSEVNYTVQERKFERKTIYTVEYGESFRIDSIDFVELGGIIDENIQKTLYKNKSSFEGQTYSLEKLISGRKTLSWNLMNNGYYYFRPGYFEFTADTLNSQNKVKLKLGIKENTPEEAFRQYSINKIYIEDNFNYGSKYKADTQLVNGIYYLTPKNYIKPRVVANTIHLQPDSLYNRYEHMKTLGHLRALNVYKFVNILYTRDDSTSNQLNTQIKLVPLSKMSLSGELNANVKSNNFAGPGMIFSFTNRNTFKGAEVLSFNFGGRFETQLGQSIQGNTSYEVRMDANLQLPRLYPLRSRRIQSQHIPITTINFGVALQERINWYQMINWNTALRYNWRSSEKVTQRFSPVDINLSNLLKTTQDFEEYLNTNPSVRRSFEEQFILGGNYDFYYSKSSDRMNTPFFLGFTLDFSGNLISGIMNLTGSSRDSVFSNGEYVNSVYRVFSTPYSQFIRSIIDIRKSFDFWPKHTFATRFIIAGGYPYGNSVIMPYIKQFYVGGANSLRGFLARSVGPGTYNYKTDENVYVDQAADLKLELNMEYRFPLWGNLQSALFADVGNIWLVNEDEKRPGGKFNVNTFYNELAVSSGVGLRYEINPVIIRFDWAWPIRYPYKYGSTEDNVGSNWVVKQINFTDYHWRKENIILNISLGYPF